MTGRIAGRRNQVRYYQVSRARNNPRTDNPLKGFVAAEPLERAIVGVLREVLVGRSDLRDSVKRALDRLSQSKDNGRGDRASMERDLNRRQRQIAAALDTLIGDEAADRPIQDRSNRYRAEAARLSAALRATPLPSPIMDIDSVADRVANDMADLSKNFLGDDLETVRQIVGLLVGRMEADLTTKEIEIDLRIPDWLAASLTRQPTMGLDAMLACRPFDETQQPVGVEIATYRCQQTAKRPVCFDCRRVRRAA